MAAIGALYILYLEGNEGYEEDKKHPKRADIVWEENFQDAAAIVSFPHLLCRILFLHKQALSEVRTLPHGSCCHSLKCSQAQLCPLVFAICLCSVWDFSWSWELVPCTQRWWWIASATLPWGAAKAVCPSRSCAGIAACGGFRLHLLAASSAFVLVLATQSHLHYFYPFCVWGKGLPDLCSLG